MGVALSGYNFFKKKNLKLKTFPYHIISYMIISYIYKS
jgi:hypothetical protein